jgi:hypothetical protein
MVKFTLYKLKAFFNKAFIQTIIVSIASIVLYGCGSSKKTVASSTTVKSLPPLQESVVNIPVKFYAKPYIKQAESMAPLEFTSEKWPDYYQSSCDFRYKYRFVRSNLGFACINNRMTISFAGNYQIAGGKTVCAFEKQVSPWIGGSCGFGNEPMRRVLISINSQLEFLPNYTVRTTTLPEKVQAIDKCTVTIFNNDVTQQVVDSIGASVAAFGSSMDRTIAGMNFNSTLQTLASKVGKKIPLMDYGFIKLNPSAVKAGNLNYRNDTLYFTLGLACFPELSSDSANISVTNYLPPLSTGDLTGGFLINTNAGYEYPYIDSLLSRFIRNKHFNIEGNEVIIRNVQVSGLDNNKVELKIDFGGTKRGILYLTGTPSLDVDKQIISIPDLDYSLKTPDVLLNVGKTLFNKKIINMMREKAVLKIGEVYNQNKLSLDSALNRNINNQISTSGITDEIKLTGLVIKKDQLLFQVRLRGLLTLIVKS